MASNSSHKRFPRQALFRRVWEIMDDVDGWRQEYRRRAAQTDSPTLKWKLSERADGCDEVFHQLNAALSSWRLWS